MKISRGTYADGRRWVQLGQQLAIEKVASAAGLENSRRYTTPASGEPLRATQVRKMVINYPMKHGPMPVY